LLSLTMQQPRFARAWLTYYALFWALVPIVDAQSDHGRRLSNAAIVEAASPPGDAAPALCALCDLLHSAGGSPVARIARVAVPTPAHASAHTALGAPRAVSRGATLSRAPPAA
jgi:hypothetical protein